MKIIEIPNHNIIKYTWLVLSLDKDRRAIGFAYLLISKSGASNFAEYKHIFSKLNNFFFKQFFVPA
ncbi:MAG TPA: hypothetical protein VMZ29_02890 [Candidatus Bathyarchaeia archaeon]|nr:hypothetical protein [Candidatus Bathyarchaeia archaeon]